MSAASIVAADRAEDPLVLALDVGTSSARALVYDGGGRAVQGWEAHRHYALDTTADGGAYFDPNFLISAVEEVVDRVLAALGPAGLRVRAVACDTFWHSLMGADAAGAAVTPVFTWADTRSAAAVDQLRNELDERGIQSRTGCVLHTSYWPAKLRWLARSEPELTRRVATWMSFGEYFYLKVFGQGAVSISMASGTGIFDQNECRWDSELLAALDLNVDHLYPLRDFSSPMTGPVRAYAQRWPSLAAIPWYLPLGDGACNNVGSGGTSQAQVVVMIGTSGALRVVREAERVDIPPGLWTYRVDAKRFVQGGAFSNGGNLFAWLEQTFLLDALARLEEELAAMEPDGHGLTVLPFLAGERSPDWDASLRAALVGMGLHTTALDVARAAMESVALRFGLVYEILLRIMSKPTSIIGSGTALINSPAWLQIMTDVLADRLTVSAVGEATSRGAALLGLEALGAVSNVTDFPVPLGAEHAPNAKHTEIYRAALRRQERLRKALVPIMHG